MKVNKVQAVIYIFKMLLEKEKITKSEIQNEIEINDLTFRRYIQELRAYLMNFDEPYELKYTKSEDVYILKRI